MATASVLGLSISYHSWNADCSMVALSPHSNEVHIYSTNGAPDDVNKWTKKYTLTEHTQFVSAIDWCHATNQILTCSHDRNAYVWKYLSAEDLWKPMLVILRIPRAATTAKWAPNGKKFAVGSGAKSVPICHYEAKQDWWISDVLKGHKSTILSVAWSPNSKFIVTGACDFKCRVFSAFVEGIDSKDDDGYGEVFGDKQNEFSAVLAEFDQCRAWVNCVSWSPGGFRLAFSGQDCRVNFVQLLAGSAPSVQTVVTKNLPFLDCAFLSDNCLVLAGFDYNPLCITASGDEANPVWAIKMQLDKNTKDEDKKDTKSAVSNIRDKWKQADSQKLGMQKKASAASEIFTRHQNTITNVVVIGDNKAAVRKHFTTCGLDGQIMDWDLSALGAALSDLGLA